MNFKIILRAFFIVLILFIVISLSYYFYLKYFIKKQEIDTTENTSLSDQNVFKKIDLSRYEDNTDELIKVLTTDNYWENWSWEEKMIETEIVDILPDTSEFIIRVSRPTGQEFTKFKQRTKIDCPASETVEVSKVNPTNSLSAGGFNIFDKAVIGDIFFAYCLDKDCLNLGKECILINMAK